MEVSGYDPLNSLSRVIPTDRICHRLLSSVDFTKLYNRMRQHQKVLSTLPTTRNGTQGIKGEADTEADMPLPVRNVRRGGAQQTEGEEEGERGRGLTPRQRRAMERRMLAEGGQGEGSKGLECGEASG